MSSSFILFDRTNFSSIYSCGPKVVRIGLLMLVFQLVLLGHLGKLTKSIPFCALNCLKRTQQQKDFYVKCIMMALSLIGKFFKRIKSIRCLFPFFFCQSAKACMRHLSRCLPDKPTTPTKTSVEIAQRTKSNWILYRYSHSFSYGRFSMFVQLRAGWLGCSCI